MMDHPKRNPGRALTSLLFLITATLLISSGQHVPAVAGDDPELTRLYGGTPVRELDGPEPFRSGDAFDVELVDHVDCTRETHDFRSDGKTELIELKPGRTFRVTGPPKQKHYNVLRKAKGRSDKPEDISEFVTPWFSYKLDLDGDGQYMIVMETINDRPRHTSLITYVRSREI